MRFAGGDLEEAAGFVGDALEDHHGVRPVRPRRGIVVRPAARRQRDRKQNGGRSAAKGASLSHASIPPSLILESRAVAAP